MGKHNLAIKEITCVIVIKTMKNYQWMCLKILRKISDFLEKYHILPYMFLCNIGLYNLKGLSVGCSRRQEIKLNLG